MVDQPVPQRRTCGTKTVHERLLRNAPGYREARDMVENQAFRMSRMPEALRTGCTQIAVVVHVLYNDDSENISDEQIRSQITVLNADFRARNTDVGSVPAAFQPLVGDARLSFALASLAPDGTATDGIVRVATAKTSFSDENDDVYYTARGGSDAWDRDRYLNIWVCTLSGGLLGFAPYPGAPAAVDGVVVLNTAFGTTGTASAPFNLGRTATHEIGHWLNLIHIWGDDGSGCTGTDAVADTPDQVGPNTGTPAFPSVSCMNGPNGDMFMNYMDYVDDAAMFMFSVGQVTRMHAALDGARSLLGVSVSCGPGPDIVKPIKESPKDAPKDSLKDLIKDNFKDIIKDRPKDFTKETVFDPGPKPFFDPGPKSFGDPGPKSIFDPGPKSFGDPGPKPIFDPGPKSFLDPDPFKSVKDQVKFGALDTIDSIPWGPQVNPGVSGAIGGGLQPFVLATNAPQRPQDSGAAGQQALLLGIMVNLLKHYAYLGQSGLLDAQGMAAWQELATLYQSLTNRPGA